jgi:hypothetical protein
MPGSGMMIAMMLNSGIAQYPDAKLYNAAKTLPAEERPNVPVKIKDQGWRVSRGQEAIFERQGPRIPETQITVQQKSNAYKSFDKRPQRLAAVLAHEAMHDRGHGEADAYQRQLDVLTRMGEKDNNLLKAMVQRIQLERDKQQNSPK